jgi:hypothetical protein
MNFESFVFFKRKVKIVEKEKRVTGCFWLIEASRPIKKTGVWVDFAKVRRLFLQKF